MKDCPPEPRVLVWVGSQKNYKNLTKIHPRIQELMVATAMGKDTSDVAINVGLASKDSSATPATSDPKARTRGAKK